VAVLLDSQPAASVVCRGNEDFAIIMPSTRRGRFRLRSVSFTIDTYIHTHTHIYIYMHVFIYLCTYTSSLRADGLGPHACARIGARLSRDVSRGGFPWYPSSTSNLFVCIGMSLCRLIHARRPCRERHVGCSIAPIRSCECTCIFYWRHRACGFPIAQFAPHASREHLRFAMCKPLCAYLNSI